MDGQICAAPEPMPLSVSEIISRATFYGQRGMPVGVRIEGRIEEFRAEGDHFEIRVAGQWISLTINTHRFGNPIELDPRVNVTAI